MAGSVFGADSPAVVSPPATDPVAEALPILQAGYPDFSTLHYQSGDRLADLITRSNGRISLVAPDPLKPFPIVTATLADTIIYWRLASFSPEKDWKTIATELQQERQTATGVILDLRSSMAPDDYHGAAQVLQFFTANDPTLTSYRYSTADSLGWITMGGHDTFPPPIVVLTNNQTTGAAEALAACLQADGALVVGRATAGKMGVFKEQTLASGETLRYFASPVWHQPADATFTFPQHHDLVWGQAVTPDIDLTEDDHTEKAALTLIRDNHISDVIQESAERHRLSEASLVKGQDPELDEYLTSLERRPVLLSLPVIHDTVLISAIDSLRAIQLSQRPLPVEAVANAPAHATTSSVQ